MKLIKRPKAVRVFKQGGLSNEISVGELTNEDVQKLRADAIKAKEDADVAINKAKDAAALERAKIIKIQKHNRIKPDGIWGPVTQRAYNDTKAIQQALADSEHYAGKIDGVNGPKTREALAKYRAEE